MANSSLFPASFDAYTNPASGNFTNSPSLSTILALANDSLSNLETKVGVNSSAVTSSLDYKLGLVTGAAQALSNANSTVSGANLTTTAITLGETDIGNLGLTSANTTPVSLLSLAVTIPAGGRRIKITYKAIFRSSVAADTVLLRIKEGATALSEDTFLMIGTTNQTCMGGTTFIPTVGAHTYSTEFYRAAGTGLITLGNNVSPSLGYYLIELI